MAPVTVKSAQRVLEVLEFFAIRRSDASLTEIAGALGYPLSSTSVLLASLVRTGYLFQTPGQATLRTHPTGRRTG